MSNKPNIWELIYNKADKTFLIVIRGHIYIEYLLNKMIDAKKKENDEEVIGFRKKLIFLKNAGVIKDEMKDYLFGLNEIRNKYAHDLKYKPNYEEAHGLARKAQKAGSTL